MLPDFEAWAVFSRVAARGSFTRAAADLGLSNATVSKLVARLENRLGERLFHRTSRRLSLTEAGRTLALKAARLVSDAEDLEAGAKSQSVAPRGVLRVAAPMSFGLHQLAPVLPKFLQSYPEISVDLRLDDQVVDLVREGIDVAVRIAALADSSLIVRKLCPVRRFVVGAPRYFKAHGTPRRPRDLATHACLTYSYLATETRWRFTHKSGQEESVDVAGPLAANNADALAAALEAGAGIALQPDFVAWRALKSRKLVRVLTDWEPPPLNVNVVSPAGGPRAARVDVFIAFLVKAFAADAVPWTDARL